MSTYPSSNTAGEIGIGAGPRRAPGSSAPSISSNHSAHARCGLEIVPGSRGILAMSTAIRATERAPFSCDEIARRSRREVVDLLGTGAAACALATSGSRVAWSDQLSALRYG